MHYIRSAFVGKIRIVFRHGVGQAAKSWAVKVRHCFEIMGDRDSAGMASSDELVSQCSDMKRVI